MKLNVVPDDESRCTVVIVNSEFESTHLAQVPCVDTEWLRVWEVAGTPHGNARSNLDEPDRRGNS